MSLNLTVPTEAANTARLSGGGSSMGKPRIQRRAKSPAVGAAGSGNGAGGGPNILPPSSANAKSANRNSGISASAAMNRNIRAKSRSPNPSFCSVLSRVKDWEIGAFTPKTALAGNNLDGDSDTSISDVSNGLLLCPSNDPDQRSAATPWRNDGSPEPKTGTEENSGAKLMKSNLSSNIGKNAIDIIQQIADALQKVYN